jgi:hypothetical protein
MGSIKRELLYDAIERMRPSLEARHGRIEWLHVADHYSADRFDIEPLVEYSVRQSSALLGT